MKSNKSTKKPVTYTYQSADGSTFTLEAGKDGVTRKWLNILERYDADQLEQDDYLQKHCAYRFQNAVVSHERESNDQSVHPYEQIPDPNADILKILFPECEEDSPLLKKLENAIAQLTENQRELIHELYGQCKSMAEIAREQGVNKVAIFNRRDKILRRLIKLANIN